jgi:hypothetical protein
MTNRESVLADLYPLDFDTDRNGFRHDWQGVALLPFVDEARLTAVYEERLALLPKRRRAQNAFGCDRMFAKLAGGASTGPAGVAVTAAGGGVAAAAAPAHAASDDGSAAADVTAAANGGVGVGGSGRAPGAIGAPPGEHLFTAAGVSPERVGELAKLRARAKRDAEAKASLKAATRALKWGDLDAR